MEGVTATKRRREPSRKLKSAENAAEAATSHQKAARAAHLRTQGHGKTTELIAPASISTAHHSASPPTHEYDNEEATEHEPLSKKVKRRRTEPKFPEQEKLSTPVHVSSDSENDQDEIPLTRQDSRQDIRPFFKNLRNEGKSTKTDCTLCGTTLVNDVTTLRRHMQSTHLSKYYAWIKKIGVESKLPHDRKKVAMEKAQQADQTTLDVHLQGKMSKDCVVKYSDANFKQAALKWLIMTDQPLCALDHPNFAEMITVASQANVKVKIPGKKDVRSSIITLFNKNIEDLGRRFSSDTIGEVSLTCDAWQASNADAYFTTTAHWIEESMPGVWVLQFALIGFTKMNTSHDGTHLGEALYCTIKRVKLQKKVGWVTCDNASNNTTMLQNFALRLNQDPSRSKMKHWDPSARRIRCLAHVVNLTTQSFLSNYSKSKHFDPEHPDDHEEGLFEDDRDEIGLIRAAAVKIRSSAKRKETFLKLQPSVSRPLMLLMDMPVRWSSTYYMLRRAEPLKEVINEFLYTIAREERDEKQKNNLRELALSAFEWKRVKELCQLLAFAESAQHAFSSESEPTLHHGLPALEALHTAWSTCAQKAKFSRYSTSLQAGINKLTEYYVKTSTSHAYALCMVLDPSQKMSYFNRNWPDDTVNEMKKNIEVIFKERYTDLFGNKPPPLPLKRSASNRVTQLLAEMLDSDDEPISESTSTLGTGSDLNDPWRAEFNQYLDSQEYLGEMPLVKWWGLNIHQYPTWASLARDHLAIMASSVSSERAFSSAGITISKRRNRLQEDIVEALQCLKGAIQKNIIFRDEEVILTEQELEDLEYDDTNVEIHHPEMIEVDDEQ